jgi:hypothetical protein
MSAILIIILFGSYHCCHGRQHVTFDAVFKCEPPLGLALGLQAARAGRPSR